jgi:hypothetical protein
VALLLTDLELADDPFEFSFDDAIDVEYGVCFCGEGGEDGLDGFFLMS